MSRGKGVEFMDEHRMRWERDGFFILEGYAPRALCRGMHARVVELTREDRPPDVRKPAFVLPEVRQNPRAVHPEDRVSKVFKLHRDPIFHDFITSDGLLDIAAELLGPDLDCFLSQFIFKNPGAMGQPWHQDSYYFRFDRGPQLGIWLAVTEATLANGCLHVLPGSHHEPVHDHVPDARPDANPGYVEIVDHDMTAEIPVRMQTGDLLVFHSHLMHRSTDNLSAGIRAAMVFHYAAGGTREVVKSPVPINDWMPVRRVGRVD